MRPGKAWTATLRGIHGGLAPGGHLVLETRVPALHSDSTLRFRERDEVEATLMASGFEVVDVRDAPDRPGREWVFVARRA